MIISGLQKFSLIDYPGKCTAILFTRGCNMRCHYCHNPELVLPSCFAKEIPLADIFSFLESRKGKLDAVSITGGEPTEHSDLLDLLKRLKEMGFFVKLDSNGSRPEVLKSAIEQRLVDYLAMDVKAPLDEYSKIIGTRVPAEKLRQSIEIIMSSGLEYEFRTTIVKSLTSIDDLKKIAKTIRHAKKYFLQRFIPTKLVDENYRHDISYSYDELEELSVELMNDVEFCGVR